MRAFRMTAAALAVAVVTVAGCTSQSAPSRPRPTPMPRAAGHTSAAHRPVVRTKPAAVARPKIERRTTPPVVGPVACPNGAVAVTAARGGALPGQEVALLMFTNRSHAACTLTGFPGVELLAHHRVLGRPAIRSSVPARTLRLAPGASVTARLIDDSRCNAPLSDSVGVYVPNQTVQLRVGLQLRGCALTIDPVRS
jgi:hypothetical protein